MLQNLLPLLPRRLGAVGLASAIGAAVLGTGLWLLGARFSRPLLATAAAIGGAAIGFNSPRWFGWTLDPWIVAVLGSLGLGICGFLGHRWVAAVGLGIILSIWALLGAISSAGLPNKLVAALLPSDFLWSQIAQAPRNLSAQLLIVLLVAGGAGLVGGTMIALHWPRLGTALFWALAGLSVSLAALLSAAQDYQPSALRLLPPHADGQVLSLILLIGVGAAVQWRMAYVKGPLFGGKSKSGAG